MCRVGLFDILDVGGEESLWTLWDGGGSVLSRFSACQPDGAA